MAQDEWERQPLHQFAELLGPLDDLEDLGAMSGPESRNLLGDAIAEALTGDGAVDPADGVDSRGPIRLDRDQCGQVGRKRTRVRRLISLPRATQCRRSRPASTPVRPSTSG